MRYSMMRHKSLSLFTLLFLRSTSLVLASVTQCPTSLRNLSDAQNFGDMHYDAKVAASSLVAPSIVGRKDRSCEHITAIFEKPRDRKSWSGASQKDDDIVGIQGELIVPRVYNVLNGTYGGQAWFGIDRNSKCRLSVRTGIAWRVHTLELPTYVAFVEVGRDRLYEFELSVSANDALHFSIASGPSVGNEPADLIVKVYSKSLNQTAEVSLRTLIQNKVCDQVKDGKKCEKSSKHLKRLCDHGLDRGLCHESAEWMISRVDAGGKSLPMAKYKGLRFENMSYATRSKQEKRVIMPKMFKQEEGMFRIDVSTCELQGDNEQMECRFGIFSGRFQLDASRFPGEMIP